MSKICKAEKEYISRQIAESSGNIKKHWNVIKKATNKLSNKEDITTEFHYQGTIIKDLLTNAENINHYYANVGPQTNASVGNSTHGPSVAITVGSRKS